MTPSFQKLLYGWLIVLFVAIIFIASIISWLPWYSIFIVFPLSMFLTDILCKPRNWNEVFINSAILGFFEGIILISLVSISFGNISHPGGHIEFRTYVILTNMFFFIVIFSVFNFIGCSIFYFIRKRKIINIEQKQQDDEKIFSFENLPHKICGIIPSIICSILIIIGVYNPWMEYEYIGSLMNIPNAFVIVPGIQIFIFALTAVLLNWLIFHRRGIWIYLGHVAIGTLIILFTTFGYLELIGEFNQEYLQYRGISWGLYITIIGGLGLLLSGLLIFYYKTKKIRNNV